MLAPAPPCRYAFQWWLLPPSEGGAGPGLIDEPYAIVCAATAILLFCMLAVMCVLSVPSVRRAHHNLFELSHRYVGWALLGILWIHVAVKAAYWANFDALGQELPAEQKVRARRGAWPWASAQGRGGAVRAVGPAAAQQACAAQPLTRRPHMPAMPPIWRMQSSWGHVMYWGVNTWAAVALSFLVWHPW